MYKPYINTKAVLIQRKFGLIKVMCIFYNKNMKNVVCFEKNPQQKITDRRKCLCMMLKISYEKHFNLSREE